jgi:simple sugar transport system ATP-binding protein
MQRITKRYGATLALNQVDFEARAGAIHALLGENGAGKSTLMHILSGLTRPDSGAIQIAGKTVRLNSPRDARDQGIAMVHQHFTLVPAFTVAENLALDTPSSGAEQWAFGLRRYLPRQRAAVALERARALGWELDPDARVLDLSVGAQQRVEIIKALATDASLLIFDEPTAVLAEGEVDELFRVLRALRDEGRAVILIAHKLAEILAVADQVTVLRRGTRVASTSIAETDADQLATWMVGETTEESASPPDAPQRAPAEQRRPNASPALTVSQMAVRGDRGEMVLKQVSLQVRCGEIFGIGGVDGNGQRELAEALVGLRPLESGCLTWNGADFVPGKTPRVGYIPQDRRRDGLATTLSIEENLLFDAVRAPAFRRGPFLKRKALGQLARTLITQFDVRTSEPLLPASALSGGNQQKIVVARALHSEPELIVAMNPTRGLDIGATRFVQDQLLKARARGAAIVLISTDFDEVRALSDRAAILANGQLTDFALETQDAGALGRMLGGLDRRDDARQEEA